MRSASSVLEILALNCSSRRILVSISSMRRVAGTAGTAVGIDNLISLYIDNHQPVCQSKPRSFRFIRYRPSECAGVDGALRWNVVKGGRGMATNIDQLLDQYDRGRLT